MLTSIGVLAGALIIKYFNVNWIDPLFSILIAIYLILMSWDIFKSSLKIMMQFTPKNIDIGKITGDIVKIDGIKNIHHIHVWQINEHDIMFEAHIDLLSNITIADFENILDKAKAVLKIHGINHITLQPEYSINDSKSIVV
jgi:cobalt-zinc-cadmium efflux system protein